MSNMIPEPQGQPGTGQENAGQESHPPYWNELQELPEAMRPVVEPTFKKWEQQVNQRFQQQAQQYQRYQPYEQIINQYQPNDVQMAIQLATQLRDNPEEILKQLAASLDYDIGEDDVDPDEYMPDGDNAELTAMRQAISDLSERIENDTQTRSQEAEETEIWNSLVAVDEEMSPEYGPMDMEIVLTRAATYPDQGLESALTWYYENVARPSNGGQQVNGAPTTPTAPQPLGAGGGLPSEQGDLQKIYSDKKARQSMVEQLLNSANQQQ